MEIYHSSADTTDAITGRAWTAEELRHKSWEDIQKLWWVCVKERNIMDTQKLERERLKPGYGEFESNARYGQVLLFLYFYSPSSPRWL